MLTTVQAGPAVPGAAPGAVVTDPFERATRLIAQGAVFVAGFELQVGFGMHAVLPLAAVLLPLWIRTLRRYVLATTILVLSACTIAWGWILSEVTAADHALSQQVRLQSIFLVLSGVAAVAIVIWARSLVPDHLVVALFGAGALASALSAGRSSWKFDLAVPVTFVVLGLLERRANRLVPAIAVLVLGVLGVLDDGRSYFALCLLACVLTLWQLRPLDPGRRIYRWYPAMLLAAVSLVIYLLASSLLTGGYLGAEVQQRSVQQIETTGSLIVGGRPEWAATRELVKLHPSGYGPGIVPSWEDVRAGKAGLDSVNVELESKRQLYMFGGQFKLHSIAADLWVGYGWVGAGLAILMLVTLVRSMSFAIAAHTLDTSVTLAATLAAWFIFFGPIYSNWLGVCVGLGLVLLPRPAPHPAAGAEAAPALARRHAPW
jgi:hypothetical protein